MNLQLKKKLKLFNPGSFSIYKKAIRLKADGWKRCPPESFMQKLTVALNGL